VTIVINSTKIIRIMEFANKEYLLLLLLIIPYIIWYAMYRKRSEPTMRMADTTVFRYAPRSWRVTLMPLLPLLRIAAFTALVIALARPQTHNSWKNHTVEGIDIMLAMDVSTSMLAEDLRPNRIEAAKKVAAEFIAGRPNDNIGLTIFAGESFTQCPMTTDHGSLLSLLQSVRTDIAARGLIEDGTAIGMGLANAVSRLQDSKAKSRVVILLTDGSNNRGDISPMTAAEIAKSLGIRVYTIGVGASGTAPVPPAATGLPQYVNLPVEIDEKTLRAIAAATDGDFYRAKNNKELNQIYKEIDKLEKTKLSVRQFSRRYEAYQPFAWAAVIALFLELLMRITVFRRIP
jgi:Ca-activated chloride channel family protein